MKWYTPLLFPFSLLYGIIMTLRNRLFDKGIIKSYVIRKPSINIGNLSVGGTGKSPHVLYVVDLLKEFVHVATLSRGYGRRTKGFFEVSAASLAEEVGDEPLMFKLRLGNDAMVVVDENRSRTAKELDLNNGVDVVVLDDAYQHRKVKAGFQILLTEYDKPFFSDHVLPAGRLREFRCGKKRADVIIVTKSPNGLIQMDKKYFIKQLGVDEQSVFFSSIVYGDLIPFGKIVETPKSVLLVTGIAHPYLLKRHLQDEFHIEEIRYSDHHNFSKKDLADIHAKFDNFDDEQRVIVTTEKDFVRISPLLTEEEKQKYPWCYQSISVKIDREKAFNELILNYVRAIPTIS